MRPSHLNPPSRGFNSPNENIRVQTARNGELAAIMPRYRGDAACVRGPPRDGYLPGFTIVDGDFAGGKADGEEGRGGGEGEGGNEGRRVGDMRNGR